MRLVAMAAIIAATLVGCAVQTDPNTGTTTVTNPQVTAVITEVQATTRQICAYVPIAATVVDLLAIAVPGLQTATQIAQAICAAVTRPGVRRGAVTPTVRGVAIRGSFVAR